MSLGISEGKPGTVTDAIAFPLVGAIAPLEPEPDLAGAEFLGAFGAFGALGALATRLAAFLPALACVACFKLRGIVQESPCILKA